jgi:hypothetical protein
MRRHLVLFEFLQRIVHAHSQWSQLTNADRQLLEAAAIDEWYQATDESPPE